MDESPPTEPTEPVETAATAPEPAPLVGAVADEPAPPAGPATATPPAAPRLHRSSTHRVLGGVAGGLGERFDMDANVFRVAFVVLAVLWGAGVAIYLAMWAILPRDGAAHADAPPSAPEERPPARRRRAARSLVVVAAAVVGVILLIALVASIGPRPHSIPGPHAVRGLIVFWLLLLVLLAFIVTRAAGSGRSVLRAIGTLIATVLVLLIIASGAFVAYVASTGVPLAGGFGSRAWAPVSMSDVQHQYRNGIGSELVDLAGVTFPSAGYRVSASVAVGTLTIDVPARAVVDVRTSVGAGGVIYGVEAPWGFEQRPFSEVPTGLTAAQVARAPHLIIDAAVGVGQIRISRGD